MNGARQLMSIGAAGTARPPDPARRVRVPAPLIRSRLPSGRGATEQPNATGDGDAALTPVFWVMVVLPVAPLHARGADGDRRRGVGRGGAAVVPAVAGHLGDLRDRHRDGASIGRENAPKLMGGASASLLAGWARLSPAQRRLLMACGGGLAPCRRIPLVAPGGRNSVSDSAAGSGRPCWLSPRRSATPR